jgi:hypothetical protein
VTADEESAGAPQQAMDGRARAGILHENRPERADGAQEALRAVQTQLLREIDTAVSKLERARVGESTREHLEILRSLLRAQVTAYLDHFISRRATLYSHTSVMYAGEVGPPGVLSTTFRGLVDGGTLSGGQAATLKQLIADRRTLLVYGDRATGKSTLLNSLFELVPVDERFVAVERGPDLPALKERSFCVRLGVDGDTDIPALFMKARRMAPGRLVVGEMHAPEAREFFGLLADDPRVRGLATVRAVSVSQLVDAVVRALGGTPAEARAKVAAVRPVFAHMHSDEKGLPRLAALWDVGRLSGGELELSQVDTGLAARHHLAAET